MLIDGAHWQHKMTTMKVGKKFWGLILRHDYWKIVNYRIIQHNVCLQLRIQLQINKFNLVNGR